MAETYSLKVPTLDRAPMWGTGGELVPLHACDGKSMAAKLTEEAAEAYVAWQILEMRSALEFAWHADAAGNVMKARDHAQMRLADELADLIVLACDLAKVHDLDLQAALDRCWERNRERGRIDPCGT